MRRFIRQNAFLYPLYIKKILRNQEVEFPSSKTNLHATGFPRSGNTYCMNIIQNTFPELKISTHIHTIASLKLAIKYKVPTIILLREPKQACISLSLLYKNISKEKTSSQILLDYIQYHKFILRNIKNFKILLFEEIISSPEFIIKSLADFLQINVEKEFISKKANEGQRLVEQKETNKPKERSSLPSPIRDKLKQKIEVDFTSNKMMESAKEVFELLSAKSRL